MYKYQDSGRRNVHKKTGKNVIKSRFKIMTKGKYKIAIFMRGEVKNTVFLSIVVLIIVFFTKK